MSPLAILIILLKFLVPALILVFPFQASWANYFLDIVDGDVLQALGLSEYNYQSVDKSADLVSYFFMVIAASRWKIRKIAFALFAYRAVGQVLFFITRNELIFVVFQNFLEPLIMVYSLLIFIKKGNEANAYKLYKNKIFLVWGIILAYKLWNEWSLHYANIDLSTFFFGINGGA